MDNSGDQPVDNPPTGRPRNRSYGTERSSAANLAAFGAALAELRTERGLSQYALAKRAGMRQSSLSVIENGQRSPGLITLTRLANALGLTLAQFVDITTKEPAL